MKKKSIIFIIVVLLGIFVTLYFTNNNTSNTNNKNNNGSTTKDNKPSDDACLVDYKCLTIDNKEYYFSIKTEVLVSNVYDYDTDSNINGKLYINDSKKLVFLNDKDNPIKEYTFDGDVISIDIQTGNCKEFFVVVLTSTGKVYKVEDNKNLLEEDPFYEISNGNKIKDITLYDSEDLCNNIIYALDENNKIINLK